MDDAEGARFRARHLETADRNVGSRLDMLLQHDLVVHFVNMVASQQDDKPAAVPFDNVDVLIDRVGSPRIPHRLRDALARGQDIEAFVALGAKEIPAHLKVTNEAVSLVLRCNRDPADARIQGVRESEIDNPRLPAEIDGRFGPPVSQLQKPAAAAARENESQSRSSQRLVGGGSHPQTPSDMTQPSSGHGRSMDDEVEAVLTPWQFVTRRPIAGRSSP